VTAILLLDETADQMFEVEIMLFGGRPSLTQSSLKRTLVKGGNYYCTRQHEEFFLTAAQSLFAVALIFHLRFTLPSALILFALFVCQLGIGLFFQQDEPLRTTNHHATDRLCVELSDIGCGPVFRES
jgi:hypothetical protein